ncbi:hypothetical protein [Lacipirellula parvula]|uniref:Uncharacterized protein n=1 Tax=Lacipirellula parvula TaxID=2650471 RepID=A0A5K7XBX6_9BACT|nr:hypothetical protein [Lacipirellula parvula]BBO33452.1 hypothetical protein PLANPX_3064 [Lacipirellula parvula]
MAGKPSKPYASYPLYAHAGGVWAKKILGKVHYFGPWSDPQGALESYLEKRDYLHGGLEPPTIAESVGELIESFLDHKRAHLATGDITRVTFREYETTCDVIRAHFGKFAALCDTCEVTKHGFYSLRRTFETIATTASVSQAAIDHIMGHARNDMASVYRQQIFDQQLKECADHVRAW